MKTIFILILFCFAGVLPTNAQEPDWYAKVKQLRILKSTDQDVIRVFDLYSKINGASFYFTEPLWGTVTKDENFAFVFTQAHRCPVISRRWATWNVPARTLLAIYVSPTSNNEWGLDKLPFSIEGFERSERHDKRVMLQNREEGISVEATADGRVLEITFSIPSNMEHLICPEPDPQDGPVRIVARPSE